MAIQTGPQAVEERLQTAQNQHDLEAFLDCIDPDYQSEQPVHPHSAFHGHEQVRKNWSAIFSGVPNFRAEIVRTTTEGILDGQSGIGQAHIPAVSRSRCGG
jgi:hypothetical protein